MPNRNDLPRVAIAATSRFHVLDLARELHKLGYSVDFYSFLPRKRAETFGLDRSCHVDLSGVLAPASLWQFKAPNLAPGLKESLTWRWIDVVVEQVLRPCDLFIFMSGFYVRAAEKARSKYGAKLFLHRGSKHIEAQKEILENSTAGKQVSQFAIRRELSGYNLADRIAVPSSHVVRSFQRDTSLVPKLMLNPYGVDLDLFQQTVRSERDKSVTTFIFAGIWSYRKGCDLLIEVMKRNPDFQLLHAGPEGDLPFSKNIDNIKHLGNLDQKDLVQRYHQADAFVLASREDGFGLVIPQALATGLPIVCTTDTGGPDLAHTPALESRIETVASGNLNALEASMRCLSDKIRTQSFMPLLQEDRNTLCWSGYAKRYDRNIRSAFEM